MTMTTTLTQGNINYRKEPKMKLFLNNIFSAVYSITKKSRFDTVILPDLYDSPSFGFSIHLDSLSKRLDLIDLDLFNNKKPHKPIQFNSLQRPKKPIQL